MTGIFVLLAIGFGISLMLPDGAEGEIHGRDNDTVSEDPSLETGATIDLFDQLDLADAVPEDADTTSPDEVSDDYVSDMVERDLIDLDSVADENNRVGTSNAPYENDFDLNAFEIVEFAEDFDSDLVGSTQSDLLVGGQASDLVNGDAGDDYLYGGGGSDTLLGGEGDDLLVAVYDPYSGDQAEASVLQGGAGADTLIGENGDLLAGGEDDDFFHVFADADESGAIAHISDFDVSSESLLIEIRSEQIGEELNLDLRQTEFGVEVAVNGMTVVFLDGVDQTAELRIQVAHVV